MPHNSRLASSGGGANNPTPMGMYAQTAKGKREHRAHEQKLARAKNRRIIKGVGKPGSKFLAGLNSRVKAGGPSGSSGSVDPTQLKFNPPPRVEFRGVYG